MAQINIPLVQDMHFKQRTILDVSYTLIDSYIVNGMLIKESNGEVVVQKRRGYTLINHDLNYSSGKSIFNWNATAGLKATLWIAYSASDVNYVIGRNTGLRLAIDTIAAPADGAIKWCQTIDPYAVVNIGGAEGCYYVAESGGLYSVTQLTNATHGFPTGALAQGIAELDTFVFVAQADGKIYNSNVGDVTTWTSTDFLTAERAQDTTKFIAKQLDQIVVVGTESIEVFYNANNPAGSPLARREDIFYSIGTPDFDMIDSNEQYIAFIGSTRGQAFPSAIRYDGIYLMENLQLKKISTDELDFAISSTTAVLRIAKFQGRPFVLINGLDANYTFAYDIEYGVWHPWKSDYFSPLTPISMEAYHDSICIANNSDIFRVQAGVVDGDPDATNSPISLEIVTDDMNFGNYSDKFVRSLSLFGDNLSGGTISVSYSDDAGTTWSTARDVDMERWQTLYRLGNTQKRRFKFTNSDEHIITLRACNAEIDGATVTRKGAN